MSTHCKRKIDGGAFHHTIEIAETSSRSLVVNGEALFIAKDAAVSLGYSDPGKAVRTHCKRKIDGEAFHHTIEIAETSSRSQSHEPLLRGQ